MADTVSKHIDMTTGSLWRNIPLFAFPVAATSILGTFLFCRQLGTLLISSN